MTDPRGLVGVQIVPISFPGCRDAISRQARAGAGALHLPSRLLRKEQPSERVRRQSVEDEGPSGSVFETNPAFAAIFQQSLRRQGKDALTRGAKPQTNVIKPSPAEEVLHTALRQARRNVLQLEDMKRFLQQALEAEERQFERVQFALRRAQSDSAYIRTLQKMRVKDRQQIEDLQSARAVDDATGLADELLGEELLGEEFLS